MPPVTVTTGVAWSIVNERDTSGAALYAALPLCCAVIVQLPAAEMWTESPLTVHCPAAVKVTASPEVAVALIVKSPSP